MNDQMVGTSQQKSMKNFSHDKLWAAMRDATDLFERCLVVCFPLSETARCAWDGTDLTGEEITFGIKSNEFTEATKVTMKSLRHGIVIDEVGARYFVGEVPVIIKAIKRKYEFLQNLDKKWYRYDEYNFANPFEKYYKARYIVQ